jgi:hypothetical protein
MTLQSLPNLLSVYDFAPGDAPSQPRLADVVARKMYAGIIIASDNSRPHLEKCLNSLLHTVGLDSEVIVVDNASTDGSAEFIAEQFPWVTLVRNLGKEGLAAAYKRGIAESTGRYVVLLDPICEVTPCWLDLLLKPLEPDEHGVAADTLAMPRMASQAAASPGAAVSPPVCFAFAHRLWDALGGLSARIFNSPQDAQFGEYPCLYVPEALVYYDSPGAEDAAAAGEQDTQVATACSTAQLVSLEPEPAKPVCIDLQFMVAEPTVSIATLAWLPSPTVDAPALRVRATYTRRRVSTTSQFRTLSILLCVLMTIELVAWCLAMGRRQVN